MLNNRERAWSEIHDLLPAGGRVPTPRCTTRRPAAGTSRPSGRPRRATPPATRAHTGEGLEEETALVDLMLKLREVDEADRLEVFWRRGTKPPLSAVTDEGDRRFC